MKLCFDSIEEVKEFVGSLKGTRGGKKGDGDDTPNQAPAPLQPPQAQPGTFAPQPQPSFSPPQGGFPGTPTVDPAVMAIVGRIVARIDGAIQGGQPADAVLTWFRTQAGAGAENATMDQIKTVFLPKMAMPSLENIAKLMNA